MKKVELLAPAGNMQSLKAAISAGADAIYLAGSSFGARAYATNFNDEEIKEAIDYAHLYDVKIYVTINTLIKDDEIALVMEYVNYLYEIGVDALIIQDIGLYTLLKANFSDLELHASTQMHVHNKEGLQVVKDLGFSRAVIARETSIKAIKEYYDEDLELEVFVHGALCVSYSGMCLFSSMKNNRSGNRGECAQHCRMKYNLYDKDKKINKNNEYLLSTKDLFTLEHIKELLDAKISSLKIEGRMKRSEYVYYVVYLYRKYIDAYYDNKDKKVLEEEMIELKKLYNRDFTSGFLFNDDSANLINNYRANHQGIVIGKVSKVYKDRVELKLSEVLRQNDGIRVMNSKSDQGCIVNMLEVNGLLVNTAYKNDTVIIYNTLDVNVNDVVVKTTDSEQISMINKYISDNTRKVKIKAKFIAKQNNTMKLQLTYKDSVVSVESEDLLVLANKVATEESRVVEQLNKIKETCYEYDVLDIDMDNNLFIPIKALNELRRSAINALNEQRISSFKRNRKDLNMTSNNCICNSNKQDRLIAFVSNEEQYHAAMQFDELELYTENYDLFSSFDSLKYMNSKVMNKSYMTYDGIGEIGGISNNSDLSDSSLNVYNAYTLNFYSNYISNVMLSLELTLDDVKTLVSNYYKIFDKNNSAAIMIYGRIELMITKFCILKNSNDNKCCLNCRNNDYRLEDINKKSYLIRSDTRCLNHIYDYTITDKISDLKHYKELGIKCFVLKFTTEKQDEVKKVLKKVIKGY